MLKRIASLGAALALVVFVGAAVAADKAAADKAASNSAINGTISSVDAHTITVTDKNGKDLKLTVDTGADITCDGKTCKLDDLKKGVSVTVTTKKDDATVASKIEAKTATAKDK